MMGAPMNRREQIRDHERRKIEDGLHDIYARALAVKTDNLLDLGAGLFDLKVAVERLRDYTAALRGRPVE